MASIKRALQRAFGTGGHEKRVLFLGLDASGRTTALYRLKLPHEAPVTTIPTIGFNVETVEHGGNAFTIWDVGGCDKIRPLWRHYFAGTHVVGYFIDSNDRERFHDAVWSVGLMLNDAEIRDVPVCVLANKQDIAGAASLDEIVGLVRPLMESGDTRRRWNVFPITAYTGAGLAEAFEWMAQAALGRDVVSLGGGGDDGGGGGGDGGGGGGDGPAAAGGGDSTTTKGGVAPSERAGVAVTSRPAAATSATGSGAGDSKHEHAGRPSPEGMSDLLEEWISREDVDDDEFLSQLEAYSLPRWDHYTHLRIAWLNLKRHGRREGMRRIFASIKAFIDNSEVSRKTTFHETMTYFWVHIVHYAIEATRNPMGTFKGFLLVNPQLCDGGLFLDYYTKKLMLQTPEARSSVALPDKQPLPSIISRVGRPAAAELGNQESDAAGTAGAGDGAAGAGSGGAAPASAVPHAGTSVREASASNKEVLAAFSENALDSWGHSTMLRVVWAALQAHGRKGGANFVLDGMKAVEGPHHHLTCAYFWVQMVDLALREGGWSGAAPDAGVDDGDDDAAAAASASAEGAEADRGAGASGVASEDRRTFEAFLDANPHLRQPLLYFEYYSRDVLFSADAAKEFALPDVKPLPSTYKLKK